MPIAQDTAVVTAPKLTALPAGKWIDFELGGTRYNDEGGHGCAVREDGAVYCWGQGNRAQLGNGYTDDTVLEPRQIGSDTDWTAVTAGWARRGDGSVWYWGNAGRILVLGGGYQLNTYLLMTTPTLGGTGSSAAGFGSDTCLVKTDGTLWCDEVPVDDTWYNSTGVHVVQRTIVQVGAAKDWASATRGRFHQCAIDLAGVLSCWGSNYSGELGLGDKTDRDVPTPVAGGPYKKVVAGGSNTCAIKTDSTLWCWGENFYGQVGGGASGG